MVEIVFNKSVHKDLRSKIAEEVAFKLDFYSESFFDDCFWGNLIQERKESEYFTYDYEEEDFYVGKFGECVIFPVQSLEEAKNIKGDSLEVSKFTSDKETFFFDENWIDYWEEPILEIK